MAKKSGDGVQWKRGEDRRLTYFWRLDSQKSKDFKDQRECAEDFITKYIEKYPKYNELVYDKSWEEIFKLFGVKLEN